ncbi:MAG: hypothetical protein U0930_03775 [Pirellulales bacterium]
MSDEKHIEFTLHALATDAKNAQSGDIRKIYNYMLELAEVIAQLQARIAELEAPPT